jgi:hypothetical protein
MSSCWSCSHVHHLNQVHAAFSIDANEIGYVSHSEVHTEHVDSPPGVLHALSVEPNEEEEEKRTPVSAESSYFFQPFSNAYGSSYRYAGISAIPQSASGHAQTAVIDPFFGRFEALPLEKICTDVKERKDELEDDVENGELPLLSIDVLPEVPMSSYLSRTPSSQNSPGYQNLETERVSVRENASSRDWTAEYARIISGSYNKGNANSLTKIAQLGSEFVLCAEKIAQELIEEMKLSLREDGSLVSAKESEFGGKASGFKFERNNIFFKIMLDFFGLYGSDESAMKSASIELHALQEFMMCSLVSSKKIRSSVIFPFMTVISKDCIDNGT